MQIEKLNVFTRETICDGKDVEIANYNIEFEAISEESFIDTAEKVEKIRSLSKIYKVMGATLWDNYSIYHKLKILTTFRQSEQ